MFVLVLATETYTGPETIERVLKEHRYFLRFCPLSHEEYDVIKDVCQVLKPVVDIIEKSSNYKHAIISTLLPLVKKINVSLNNNNSDSEVAANVKRNLPNGLEKWLSLSCEDKPFAFKASFLDSRIKNFLKPSEQQRVLEELSFEVIKVKNNCIQQ